MKKLCLALLACLPLAAVANEGSISKVNGSVRVEAGQSAGDVSTVNGSVTIEEGATASDVDTVNGDILVGADSRIEGGILVEKPNLNWFTKHSHRPPRIVIGPGAVVEGKLRFEHEVELLVSDRAKIGPVEGATATPFSGDQPK